MLEKRGDLWDYHERGKWVIVPTNGIVTGQGDLVMSKGAALTAKLLHPELPRYFGLGVMRDGSEVNFHRETKIISFPVKRHWRSNASLALIKKSAAALQRYYSGDPAISPQPRIYMPHVGCGEGHLNWEDVRKVLQPLLDDGVIALEYARL